MNPRILQLGIIPSSSPVADENAQVEVLEEMRIKCMTSMEEEEERRNWTSGDSEGSCPMVWDGILCWGQTLAGDTTTLPCPHYVVGFDTTLHYVVSLSLLGKLKTIKSVDKN
ncbi:hypothetical protein J437_LFUL012930 [Ladona fulva]|uniref:G-protein coupled receptors family 2 profile 1 domain-containing protein n=1 Tax=Ladona fulva TaxID=123851 RepID=A0A8K0KEA4_LADFU|nr:hypothetical protein J437_LFUL012930 [Ladona fulva]